ncbi:MAG: hypothetical protein WCX17_04600 [Parcubacteria group bacterium]
MFQDQNKNIDDQDIEHLPVHTMLKDLEFVDNPSAAKAEEELENVSIKKSVPPANLTVSQKSSPFLNPVPAAENRPAPQETEITHDWTNRMDRIDISAQTPIPLKQEHSSKKLSMKPFIIIFSVLLVFIIAGGGYYFWSTRQQKAPDVVIDNTPEVVAPEPVPVPAPIPPVVFSTDTSNYLSIDLTNTNKSALKETLLSYVDKVYTAKTVSPVEFVIVDQQNNPITFQDFSAKLEMTFSPALTASLGSTFSLFIYNDASVTRLGLAMDFKEQTDSKNTSKLQTDRKNLLSLEEKDLTKELSPIFIPGNYTLAPKIFSSSKYNGLDIRFLNIISPEDLSVDYAIFKDKLLIGTTKMTIRAIIDKIAPTTDSPIETDKAGDSAKSSPPITTTPATTPRNAPTGQ